MTRRVDSARSLLLLLLLAPAASATPASTQQAAPQQAASPVPSGEFFPRILAGGAGNRIVFDAPPAEISPVLRVEVAYRTTCATGDNRPDRAFAQRGSALGRRAEDGGARTAVEIYLPPPPCRWPAYQQVEIRISDRRGGQAGPVLFHGTERVSVFWFPLVLTVLGIALIYPGCAMIAWYFGRRRHAKLLAARTTAERTPLPNFWKSLDPIQITANAYGRASLAKLQIFLFTLLVSGLLIYFQLRNGVLSGLSTDVLYLLGVSAFGAAGGKLTHIAKRRLSLENWAWLVRRGWLPPEKESVPQAKWRELVTDHDNKEFDIYSFQMAVFSLVVAVALVSTSLTGLATFEIPAQLLTLLGISQVVYIGGKAVEKSSFTELNDKLTEVRARAKQFRSAQHASTSAVEASRSALAVADTRREDTAAVEDARAAAARIPESQNRQRSEADELKAEILQAANMFWALYGEQIGEKPEALKRLDVLDLESYSL